MDKREKAYLLLDGMINKLKMKKKHSSERNQLLRNAIGLKFKLIRLEKNITAEAVVQDNKEVLSDVHSLYKFEQGTFHFGKLYALANYYKVDANDLFKL
jgi:hypothetical protein|tara:strand:+ start:546 stop:842 length:297 start_codon:yes stop_codon:yes gene_type:complete